MKAKTGCLPHSKDFFEVKEKLVTQRVNSSMQLLVAYDDQQRYFLDTVNVSQYKSWDGITPFKYLCGLLNSKLINYWYSHKYRMPTIGGYELESIPIIKAENNITTNIVFLVEKIISKGKNGLSYTAERLKIDFIVYHLYGLTYDEVLIVDPQTPITREEYEKHE